MRPISFPLQLEHILRWALLMLLAMLNSSPYFLLTSNARMRAPLANWFWGQVPTQDLLLLMGLVRPMVLSVSRQVQYLQPPLAVARQLDFQMKALMSTHDTKDREPSQALRPVSNCAIFSSMWELRRSAAAQSPCQARHRQLSEQTLRRDLHQCAS